MRGLPLLIGLVLAVGSSAHSAAPESDTVLAGKVNAALAADRELARLGLTVSVVNRVAVVGGPVPDASLTARIEAVVGAVPGLSGAKVTCWVPTAADPLPKMVENRLKGASPPLVLAPQADPPAEPASIPALPRPAPADTPPDDRRPVGTVTVQRIAVPPAAAGFLLDPVAPHGPALTPLPMPAAAADTPNIPATAVPTTAAPLTAATGVSLLQKDPRFAELTVTVKNGTAVISGRARRHADAWDFASAVRRLPGIDRVVVGTVAVQ